MFWFAFTLLVLGLYGATVLRRHLHEAKLLKLREILHSERMAALERELPLPDADTAKLEAAISQSDFPGSRCGEQGNAGLRWTRCTALSIGLIFLFGGFGMVPGLYLMGNIDAHDCWPLGLISIFIGFGMLLFVRLSRRMIDPRRNGGGDR